MLDNLSIPNRFQYSGDSHWFPRDDKLRTPPGPEGSNGSDGFGCRGVAGVDRLQFVVLLPYLPTVSHFNKAKYATKIIF